MYEDYNNDFMSQVDLDMDNLTEAEFNAKYPTISEAIDNLDDSLALVF